MKIRQSFVTNSSSSSYIINYYGTEEELESIIKRLVDIKNEIKKPYSSYVDMPVYIYGAPGAYQIPPDYDLKCILNGFFEIQESY